MDTTVKTIRNAFEAAKETADIGGREKMLNAAIEAAIKVIEEHEDPAVWREVASIAIAEAPVKAAALKDGDKIRKGLAKKDVAKAAAARRRDDAEVDAAIRAFTRHGAELRIRTGDKFGGELPDREWIVRGWIPANRVTLVTGAGETGKSRIMLQLAVAVATNTPWIPGKGDVESNDIAPPPGLAEGIGVALADPAAVVYASWEDELDESERRHRNSLAWANTASQPDVKQNLHLVEVIGEGALWEPGGDDPGASRHTSVKGGQTDLSIKLRAYCVEVGAKVLILDTLAAIYMCNENDRGLVRHFMSDLDKWAIENGIAVVIIAHPPKSKGQEASDYSGSTDWHGACRSMLTLGKEETPDSAEKRKGKKPKDQPEVVRGKRIKVAKANYAESGAVTWLGYDQGMGMMVAMTPAASAAASEWREADGENRQRRT